MPTPICRDAERGQTLPVWTFAVLASLALMFFALNYANVLRAQVRAQTVADNLALAMLSVQATRWNKMTMMLYAADVEEWRIRTIIQAMMDAANGNGGCSAPPGGTSCFTMYNALQKQFYKAVNRYESDAYGLQAVSYFGNYHFRGNTVVEGMRTIAGKICTTPLLSLDCQFSYHTIDPLDPTNSGIALTYRSTVQAVKKDALYVDVGGVTGTTPDVTWQPIQLEVSVCETVKPIVTFSMFNLGPAPVYIVGRAAATMVPIISEWLAPGVTTDPSASNNAAFQEPETYPSDAWAANANNAYHAPNALLPHDWYATTFPAQPYTVSSSNYVMQGSTVAPDFEVWAPWWGVIPILPYTTDTQTQATLCTSDSY